ncbi:MAG: hypothetical protein LBB72_09575, partial [Spirochaetaceae bacterium]|nr:hypothetical protein [Spirochaetaceae bacterium]
RLFRLTILVMVLVFGMTAVGCVTLTPEEEAARRAEQMFVEVYNTSNTAWYWVVRVLANHESVFRVAPGHYIAYATRLEGENYIRYRAWRSNDEKEPSLEETLYWTKKTFFVSKGESVRVNIP